MKRIFLTLASVSTLLLCISLLLGLQIGDARTVDPAVQQTVTRHMLTALAALVFAALVHALVLTYFMGTGRWMEETCGAYHLPQDWREECNRLKYRSLPGMVTCIVLLVLTGAFGAASDPASPVQFQGWFGLSGATVHFLIASATLIANMYVNVLEFQALNRNSELVDEVLAEVRRMRTERGLPV